MTHPSTTAAAVNPATTDIADHHASRDTSNDLAVRRNLSDRRNIYTREHLTDTVIALVTFGSLPLEGANDLLRALHLATINGGGEVTFRVTAAILADQDTPARTIRDATDAAGAFVGRMRWTRLRGCPGGYAIDPPTHIPDQPGQPWATVHTDLYLTVTVPAHHRHALVTTAYALLAHDLLAADPDDVVKVRTDRINLVKQPGERGRRYDFDTPDVRAWDATEAAAAIRDPRRR